MPCDSGAEGWQRPQRPLLPVVVVDDGSSDATASIAHQAGACILRHIINRGQGAALQTGIEYSLQQDADIVVTFDADGQHDVDDLMRLIAPILCGEADVVLGSRFLESRNRIPWQRRIVLRGGILFTRIVSGALLSDTHNGLRAFSRRAAESIDIRLDRMAHASELIDSVHRSGLSYAEVAVRVHYTEASLAKGQRNRGAVQIVLDFVLGKLMP